MKMIIALALLPLAACAGQQKTITREVPIEVKVPVSVPCIVDRPEQPAPLSQTISREEWDSLSTDQRENLVAAQALLRKIYGDRLTAATAGCR